jgi:serine/threonine protein phosphatase PrpC
VNHAFRAGAREVFYRWQATIRRGIGPPGWFLLQDFSYFAISEKGEREVNEDAILARPVGDSLVLGIADGLGGHARGEVASGIAISALDRIDPEALSTCEPESLIGEVFRAANAEIVLYNRDQGVNSGTTLTACIVRPGGRCTIGNIGDSRAYLIDGERFWHTRDHSYLQQLIDSGELSEREAIRHPRANIITRALGLERDGEPDLYDLRVEGRVLVLTSDGIHDYIEPGRFRDLALSPGNREAALALMEAAVSGGSTDNLSVIVCRAF